MTITTKLLIDFLIPRAEEVIAIDHPFPDDPDVSPRLEVYSKGNIVEVARFSLPRFLSLGSRFYSMRGNMVIYYWLKMVDFISSILLVLETRRRVDIYVGVEGVNTLAGLFLRKLGIVRRVIYYAFDYNPKRFNSPTLTKVVLRLDRFCVLNADVVWEASAIPDGIREKVWKRSFPKPRRRIEGLAPAPRMMERSGNSIAYIGGLGESFGIHLVIKAMPCILSSFPDAKFHIIGHIENDDLLHLVERMGLRGSVIFHGFLPDAEVTKIFDDCLLGVAPYLPVRDSELAYLDSSKAKYYASNGLPIVFSDSIQPFAEIVKRFHAGIVVKPRTDEIASAVCSLMLDKELYRNCVEGAYLLAQEFGADAAYEKAFSEIAAMGICT